MSTEYKLQIRIERADEVLDGTNQGFVAIAEWSVPDGAPEMGDNRSEVFRTEQEAAQQAEMWGQVLAKKN